MLIVYRLNGGKHGFAPGMGNQAVHGEPALALGTHHVVDRTKRIGRQNPRNTVRQFGAALRLADGSDSLCLIGRLTFGSAFADGEHRPFHFVHEASPG